MHYKKKEFLRKQLSFRDFFKTMPGEYGEGDKFLGVVVPEQRKIAKSCYTEITLGEITELLRDPYHEVRLTALLMLVYRYQKAKSEESQQEFVDFYLNHMEFINNWDLVDTTCHPILGRFYFRRDKMLFYDLAKSGNLWKQRIAMISSLYWIKRGEFGDALNLAEILINHPHDLIHKAVGWMLREIGKMNQEVELEFLRKYSKIMPRTALRYSIEKFDQTLRLQILKGEGF
ncbi:MAG: DNA alkylation repair protein [Algoriphagus sp.]|uniref:DNA alkylation repair protein n=1 Tax=Algoriphagus sp. TaxID=1872435 RepID=UPI002604A1E8|nr:DNA alkylation repair protein [Algoriphagus sp.]MDG1275743.1 DNA alkylation repair protein [Algoriphagus sp.]